MSAAAVTPGAIGVPDAAASTSTAAATASRSRTVAKPKEGMGLGEHQLGLLMVIPAIAMMLLVAAYPVLNAAWLSLHQYNVKVPQDNKFIGLANYTRILSAP